MLPFSTRVGTPHTTNYVRRLLRDVMEEAGIENVTRRRFRRNDAHGVLLVSELLGHTDPRITLQHCNRRNETVNPSPPSTSNERSRKQGDGNPPR